MAFEPVYEVAALDGLQKSSTQLVVEAKLVPPHGEEINKVLGISAVSTVSATEVFSGEARIKGKVDFRITYLSADNSLCYLEYTASFADKINDDGISGGNVCLFSKVIDTDITSLAEAEMKLSSVVEIFLLAFTAKRIKYLSYGGDGLYTHRKDYDFTTCVCHFTAGAKVNVKMPPDVRYAENRAVISSCVAGDGMVTVSGDVITDYMTDAERLSVVTPFSVEIEANGSKEDFMACCNVFVENTEVSSDAEGYDVDVAICGFVSQSNSFSPVVDAFSLSNELIKGEETTEYSVLKNCFVFSDEVEGTVSLSAGMPLADNIISTPGFEVIVTGGYALDGKAVIEGMVRLTAVYFSNETSSESSVNIEIPFSLTKRADVIEGDEVTATAEAESVSCKIRRGSDIDARATVSVNVFVSKKCSATYLSSIAEGDPIQSPSCAFSVHVIGKNETIWDVSKAIGLSPEDVEKQNPQLKQPFVGGERVVAYRRREKSERS